MKAVSDRVQGLAEQMELASKELESMPLTEFEKKVIKDWPNNPAFWRGESQQKRIVEKDAPR